METKSQMINRIAELAQENAELKANNKHLNDLLDNALKEQEEFRSENDGLKSQLDFEIQRRAVAENATEQLEDEYSKLVRDYKELQKENERLNKLTGIFSARLCEKYRQTLQEIKAIAEAPSPYIDNFGIKTATEVGYDYATICNELELRLQKVLQKITKAEEE